MPTLHRCIVLVIAMVGLVKGSTDGGNNQIPENYFAIYLVINGNEQSTASSNGRRRWLLISVFRSVCSREDNSKALQLLNDKQNELLARFQKVNSDSHLFYHSFNFCVCMCVYVYVFVFRGI